MDQSSRMIDEKPTPTKTAHCLPPIPARLDDFRQLRDGWADGMQHASDWGNGYGKAPSHRGLDWLAGRFRQCYPAYAPTPYLYPTPEGGVQAEWSLGPQEISLEVNLETRQAYWHRLNVQTIEDEAQDLNLDTDSDWEWLVQEITRWAPQ